MAYSLNGSNQRLSVASAPVTAAPLTVGCWFRANNVTSVGALIALNTSANNTNYFTIYASGNQAGDPVQLLDGAAGIFPTTSTTAGYSANTWSHACGVQSSASSRTVYLNGGNSATNTTNITPSGINQLTIGGFKDVAGNFFNGLIAEVGIWNVALTAAEIASLADGMTCDKVRPQSLVFYAPLIRNLQDVRGGLTITNNNTATVANHPRVYA